MGSLTFIGLGLYDEKDISLKALEAIRNCDKVYAEFYTSKLTGTTVGEIEKVIGRKINVLSREETEDGRIILDDASHKSVVFLTGGDPLTATTHLSLRLQAIEKGIKTHVIHGSSILTAVPGLLGLQHYKFGRTTTLVYPESNFFPLSPYEIIKENREHGLHTLVLLDIQDNRFMTINEGIEILLKMEGKKDDGLFDKDSIICGVARAGSPNPTVKAGRIRDLEEYDFGPPLHTIVIPGDMHFLEIEALEVFADLPASISKKLQKL
ncbi:MAG: diphthine synthase [Thermoplasmata archaeon]|nr:MAG: diphthine synthase [Thermoplasmata archaeon]